MVNIQKVRDRLAEDGLPEPRRRRRSVRNGAYNRPGDGKFRVGNPGGKGNPLAKQMYANRQMLVTSTDPKAAMRVWRGVIKEAERGNVQAAKLFIEMWAGNSTV